MSRAESSRRRTRLLHRLRAGLTARDDPLTVVDRAAGELLREVPADVWCAVLLDPSDLLDTGGNHAHGFPESLMPELFEIEHAEQDDVDSLRQLAHRGVAASLLSRSTGGDLAASTYYRRILQPMRLADELRVLLRDDRHVWGLLVFCRAAGSTPYTADDLALAAAAARPATVALRRSLLLTGTETDATPDVPGLLMLGGDDRLGWVSDTAKAWLDLLPERRSADTPGLPYPLLAAVARARASADGHAVARVRGRTGQWLAVHVMPTGAAPDAGTAVSIGPAEPAALTTIVLRAYGFSSREQQVAQLVLRGRATRDIAAALHITEDTVQDHLKAVFRKTGVHSRGELVSAIFTRHHLPQLGAATLTVDGRVLDEATTPPDTSQKTGMDPPSHHT
jgi:DNA-binding CsgD family transcriptional regulator